ncbi:MAG: hypothetical protein HOB13_02205, partial [Lentimicrobiaceae bacterium]|nr:hypothetical protein [Lentimicrobiaceae bacterium]MBT6016780.1 hypothetical protein [Lentimicrobiaceae bacterium]MBT6671508.1 hypothetical protein [Lentimicrobiaceae bacterium]MBT7036524.1 hypothetical protein [Lentimicrobiaceae bacterium]
MKKLIMFSAVFTFLVNILIAQNDFSHMSKRLSQENKYEHNSLIKPILSPKGEFTINAFNHIDHINKSKTRGANNLYTLDSIHSSVWDTVTNDWVFDYSSEYTYDANGNILSNIISHWDTDINDWVFDYKYEYNYDPFGNTLSDISSFWDTNINDWVFYYRSEYTYDANGNQTLRVDYAWNTAVNDWDNTWKEEVTYDANG